MKPDQTFRYQRVRFFNRVLILALILTVSTLLITLHGRQPKPLPTSTTFSATVSHRRAMKLSAAVSLSCPEFEKLFGPNYYSQLSINWIIWSKLASVLPGETQPFSNYEYNVASQQSYSLYVGSMQRQNCTPAFAAPAALTPATSPDSSFSPHSITATTTTCNIALAVQYLDSYNQQYQLLQNNQQTALEDWISNQPSSPGGLTLSLQQGAISIGTQLNTQTQNLVQQFQNIIGTIGC